MRDFEGPGRSLAVSREAMIATSHPAASLAGLGILQAGGNAVDAAVAACAVQGVVEPGSTGVGGDCFALIAPGGGDGVIAYDGSGRTPAAMTRERLLALGLTAIPRQSPHAVTIPGAVEAWARLVRDHGRLDLGEVLAPAVKLAREGFAVTPRVALDTANQAALLAADATASAVFLPGGRPPAVGDVLAQPALATTLEAIGRHGPSAFYEGEVAADMVGFLQAKGGLHTLADFAAAQGEYVAPIRARFEGHDIYECPPSGQGIIALLILNILSRFRAWGGDPQSPDRLHIEIEATRLAYAARDRFLADPALADVPEDYLLSDALADELARMIDPDRAMPALPRFEEGAEHSDTVYIAVVDRDRTAVSFINSIFHPYGAGLMSPGSGVLFHNRAQGFVLTEGHRNVVAPRKRPLHTIIPGMAVKDGRVAMPFGVMGGQYQAMGHAHLLTRVLGDGLDLQSAIDLPRLFPLPGTATVEIEARLRARVGPELEKRGFTLKAPAWPIGGAQAIRIDWERGTLLGGSDPRKDGCALGI